MTPDTTIVASRDAKKRALMAMRARLVDDLAGEPLHPRWLSAGEPHRPFPLTDLQAAHFVAKHMPEADPVGSHMYLEFLVAELDIDRLERAWRQLLAIHPMLRARVDRDGTQCVPDHVPPLSFVRYTVGVGATLDEHITAVRAEMSHKVYLPGAWPLFDIRVTRSGEAACRVHVSMDSWIVDGASADLIYRQWRLLYDSPDVEVANPNAGFRDFVLSMKAFESSDAYRRFADYWADKLRRMPEPLLLPRRSRASEPDRRGDHRRRRLEWVCGRDQWDRVQDTLRAAELSPNAALLGIFVEQLRCLGGNECFPLVVTLRNRPRLHPGIDEIVGPFSSTAIFIADDGAGTSFAERLRECQRQLWRDIDNGYVSGVASMRNLAAGRPVPSIPIVFTSSLGFSPAEASAASWLDDVVFAVSQTPGADLQFHAYERSDGVHLAWDVAAERFEPGIVDLLFERTCLAVAAVGTSGLIQQRCLCEHVIAERRRLDVSSARSNGGDQIPMTPLQQAYLVPRLIDPDAAPAAIYREFDIPALDLERLKGALNAIVEGSDVLRAFGRAETARFVAFTDACYPVTVDDLRGLDPSEVGVRLGQSRAAMTASLRGDRVWPAFVLRVARLDGDTARLQVLLDPIVFDGCGSWQFYHELFRRYAERDWTRIPVRFSYGDYARARARYRDSAAFAVDQHYWARKFEKLPPGPRWPWPRADGSAKSQRYSLEFEDWQTLKDAAAGRGLPAVAVLLGLYTEILRRWSRCDDLAVVAIDFTQRGLLPDFIHAYGDFSTLSWIPGEHRAAISLEESVRAMARALDRDRLHDWGNPFEVLRQIGGNGERRITFPATLTNCLGSPTLPGADIAEVAASCSTPGSDIDVMAVETERALVLFWEVRLDHVPGVIATAMIDDCRDMLAELSGDSAAWQRPLETLGARSGLPPQFPEHWSPSQVDAIRKWNRTDADYDRAQCLHRLFEQQAARQPGQVALVGDKGTLTYRELERRANRLARLLRRHGVSRGSRVGVLLPHSFDMIVALLAILKAGGAYVPLSLGDPRKRIASMLDAVEGCVTLSVSAHAGLLDHQYRAILLDRDRQQIEAEDGDAPPDIESRPDDTAYVIFTSGSTSEPKGVVVRHRPVVNLIEWAGKRFSFTADDRVLFVNSLGFDLSVFDVFALLAYGGSIRIVSEEQRLDPVHLARLLQHEPVTFWNSAPAYLQFVIPGLKPQPGGTSPSKLRLAFLSGDRIDPALPQRLRDLIPGALVVALGGATEATVWSNYFCVEEIDPEWTSVPYGQPIQNARYYILDEHLDPCPIEACGRLYIGGECLSSGYLKAPELTQVRFLADPFHEKSGMTMFDTGDLARLSNDGTIEFLGRVDDQVKIRGFRVGLREVEAMLARCGLGHPVAVVREETPGHPMIAAFGAMNGAEGLISDPAFWQQLREQLPEHMLPSFVYAMASLPMTANGKIDRKRLAGWALPESGRAVAGPVRIPAGEASPPSPATREQPISSEPFARFLCSAMSAILSLPADTVQPDSHFSVFGVNSLQFSVLSARIAEATGAVVGPAKLFHCTSVNELVETIAREFPEAFAWFAAGRPHQPSAVEPPVEGAAIPPSAAAPASPREHGADAAPREYAIIGMHCVMPRSDGPDALWDNLLHGRDCIELIPRERWDWRALYGDPLKEPGVTDANKAGFIRDVDVFDAALFNISPREAELMDPRQRLLLQATWRTIENAGYRPSDLSRKPVGVFIGATGDEYFALLQQVRHAIDQFSLTGGGRSFLANRLSYHFGWHGPSEVVDTTCSSSLVAVHNAIRAIESGDCAMAIAGGINIMIDARPHLSLAKLGVLSADGACKTFDASANGYARGEGLGLVLIKPLPEAEADGDHIHAVISGTAIGHGGRANSMTTPNHRAQAQVIVEAFRRGAVEPRQIGYIEAHGTGTRLGDPIEVEGIKEAFVSLYAARDRPLEEAKPISVGAIKANIGHLEAAAGIAGLLKLVLMLRHGVLPPLVHLNAINPEIDVRNTPFRFQAEASEWDLARDDSGRRIPRAACVSAFGIGGVNAHAVVREYLEQRPAVATRPSPAVVPLSAGSGAQLAQYAGLLRDAVRRAMPGPSLEDVAFTLALGRESFNARAAIVTESLEQLVEQLDGIATGSTPERVWYGEARIDGKRSSPPGDDVALKPAGALPLHELAAAWAAGRRVDWTLLERRRRVPLPGPPFAGARHWVAELRAGGAQRTFPPLADCNDDVTQGYAIRFTGDEPFIKDHSINGARIVPAAAYIVFAGMIAAQLHDNTAFRLRSLTWTRALRAADESPFRLRAALISRQRGRALSFRGEEAGQQVEYASAVLEAPPAPFDAAIVEIDGIMRRCSDRCTAEAAYWRLGESGIAYGPALRLVRGLWWAESEALAHIVVPEGEPGPPVDPALVDAALQTALLHYMLTGPGERQTCMPFSAQEVVVYEALPRECYVHATLTRQGIGAKALREYDIMLYRPDGRPVMQFKRYTGLPLPPAPSGNGVQMLRERWRIALAASRGPAPDPTRTRHLTVGLGVLAETLHRLGRRVIGNALLPSQADSRPGSGSAIPWDGLLEALDRETTIVLWYDSVAVGSLPLDEQLRFGFDAVLDLIQRLAAMRGLKRCCVVLGLVSGHGSAAPSLAALSGFARVVRQESPHLRLSVVHFAGVNDAMSASEAELLLRGVENAQSIDCFEHRIDLRSGAHEVLGIEPVPELAGVPPLPVDASAVYLITGGLGAIGQQVARAVLARGGRAALMGRSPLGGRAALLRALGGASSVNYYQADVADRAALDRALHRVRAELGPVRGIFHCAGEARPGLLRLKSLDDARQVVSAKLFGTVYLDEATREDPIEFFVLFSSLASVTGPVGAADYAYANRFEDLFAAYRNALGSRGLRRGRAVTVSWPVWSGGGMRLAPRDLDYLRAKGLDMIDDAAAIGALGACLAGPAGHYLAGCGDPVKVKAFLAAAYPEAASSSSPARATISLAAGKTTNIRLAQL
jgi:amino acid adenylation domain-containing protein